MRVIAITNQKGGVGKTTTAVHLATGFQKMGKKTLLIDTDPQCNSTDTYRAKTEGVATMYDILCEGTDAIECIQHTSLGDIIPCDKLLVQAEQKVAEGPQRYFIMKENCKSLEGMYDYIIIDTPPNMGVLMLNVLAYANEVIIPLISDKYSLQGIDELKNTIANSIKYTNPNLKIAGMLLTLFHERKILCQEISEKLPDIAKKLHTKVFDVKIREAEACKRSQAMRTSMFAFSKLCTAAEDYLKLCEELEE